MMQKKKLNIAIVCDAVSKVLCGSFVSTLRVAELLSKRGHKVILISSKHPKERNIAYHNKVKIYRFSPGVLIPGSEKKMYFSFARSGKIKKILKKEKIDIVHFMIPTPLSLATVKAARALNLKVVAHSHTQPENLEPYVPLFRKTASKIFYKYLINTYNKADIIICPSKFAEQLIKLRGVQPETKVISNGVNLSKFKKIRNPHKHAEKYGFSRDTKKIMFVGRLDPEKNVNLILNSIPHICKSYGNFEICIIGKGRLKEQLEKTAKKIKGGHKIKFLGFVSDEELIRAYNFCDIFVLPSFVELEGMVVLEAMACGKPILISNAENSASRYFVNDNGFLFDPNSPKQLAEKCLKILKNKKLMKKMGEKSYKDAKGYNIDKCISKLEEVYYNLKK
ncbi:MAG: glycosyltransferase [Candidatus Nanoarchaeia archaeon]|nr:glycosyltransferase [Candidatus Nanoarchaeia archaeon]MDD5740405.1 glycosyltransferase [Candidatus Nanoarchaeia archaeon]